LPHKSHGIETQLLGEAYEVPYIECLLILEQPIVHLPKTILSAGGFSPFRRCFSVRMYLRERKVTKDKPQTISHCIYNFLQDRIRGSAVRAFKIPVLNQGDRCFL